MVSAATICSPARGDILKGVGDGRGSRGYGQRRDAAFERGDTLLEDRLRRVGQASVDIAGVLQSETGGGVRRVAEDIGGGLIDRHRTSVGHGIGPLLAHMELQRFEVEIFAFHSRKS